MSRVGSVINEPRISPDVLANTMLHYLNTGDVAFWEWGRGPKISLFTDVARAADKRLLDSAAAHYVAAFMCWASGGCDALKKGPPP